MSDLKGQCGVCRRPIRGAFLMCAPHWRLVPRDQAVAVVRSWGAVNAKAPSPQEQLQRIRTYREHRDRAVTTVTELLKQQSPIEGATP